MVSIIKQGNRDICEIYIIPDKKRYWRHFKGAFQGIQRSQSESYACFKAGYSSMGIPFLNCAKSNNNFQKLKYLDAVLLLMPSATYW